MFDHQPKMSLGAGPISPPSRTISNAPTEIPQVIGDLERTINDLLNELRALNDKLEPVLGSESNEQGVGHPVPACSTPLGRSIAASVDMLRNIASSVRDTTSRVQL